MTDEPTRSSSGDEGGSDNNELGEASREGITSVCSAIAKVVVREIQKSLRSG